MQKKITKMKFEKFRDTEKLARKLARQLIGRKEHLHKTLVFMGDPKIAANSPIRGSYVRTPIRKVVKHLEQIADIYRVNEFRTTKLCSQCHKPAETSSSAHRYQVCRNSICDSNVWNRDVNAGNNILKVRLNHRLLGCELHPNFKRTTNKSERG